MAKGKSGICLARGNSEGRLVTKIYGKVTSYSDDPIEKKPLYHFLPGRKVFSIGSWGCNLKCTFCQNWSISQAADVMSEEFTPAEITELALHSGAAGIAYTYNEPSIWYEFVMDVSEKAREKGLKNIWVTNGFISEEPLKEALPRIDAMNIDLKAGSESFYREVCSGQLAPVMRTIKTAYEAGVHIEVTNLVIPDLNDKEDIDGIIDWLASVSPDIPMHFSRYSPQYKMNIDATGAEKLREVYEKAKQKLKYVYLGNVPPENGGSDTYCASCGNELIKRDFYRAETTGLEGNKCTKCGEEVKGVFE
ncbi:MAG: AmmeMemoRadiSam system radical SAM enzyme [Candidatus Goldiibacteriota bacterium]